MTEETTEETPEAQAEGAETEAAAETPAEGAEEAVAEATEGPSADAETTEKPSGQAAEPEEPAEKLSPKERRRRQRSTHTGKAREPRSPQQRHEERLTERAAKARHRQAVRAKQHAKRAARKSSQPEPQVTADGASSGEAVRKVRQGVVLSDKADKTITVRIDIARRHRRYEKIVRSSNTLHAHDESNEAHEGDVVRVVESRPLSRNKRWRLVEVVERAR